MTDSRRPVRRALISVYDKTGLEELARGLAAAGVEIVSTGSTAQRIADAGVAVTPVDSLTGFPECLEGRVKTLHPRVHAGILADTRKPEHLEQIADLGVQPFELVVVNLYPFTDTVASGADYDACVEQIDIGGPSMVRAAAKNHPSVAVLVDPAGYGEALKAVAAGGFPLEQRRRLAAAAFRHTGAYDVAVATWMTEQTSSQSQSPEQSQSGDEEFPVWQGQSLDLAATLRYGENPHQRAALYTDSAAAPGLAQAVQLHGKDMSYNNYVDGDAAWRSAFDHAEPCVAIIKHANPCGIAIDADIAAAHRAAHECDPVSAFGGVIAANREVTLEMAEQVAEIFTEVIIAPSYADGAVEILQRKKNIRILEANPPAQGELERKQISGGVLVQERDSLDADGDVTAGWTKACGDDADEQTLRDLLFAWRACRAVKSNAILLVQAGATVGVGMGQVNRVDSARLAVQRAGERVVGAVAASDAFFPFADGLEVLAEAGVRAVVQPGGSVRDAEVIEAAEKAGITMYFTGARHFFH
ncbi:bifunctional phosphoribosylaminoimidazolecarboxamide formyltransferase/inosine monophosphate cyclohydrolase [Dietzia natronolimnaea]|uniref:Bifunctional purine biosynthesis protein PurH n=1 Tax=Dietzia natronolimnaea TaxID=161920 RepID=A0A2A2WNI0_9ACTN|nr:bifunctional phosphoribosylaminoimidazolecarboxamide formyltransferase/IMP cyclohydrolase [Dietzia natronolimnaea]PAY22731.1 bifunctional phosphoribosylaminoimidazolecarboxamide formyltransferase/inosine monophosphate cyclohydrolase [Dietzia natronolimnaea]